MLAKDKRDHILFGLLGFGLVWAISKNIDFALAVTALFWGSKELIWDGLLKKGTPEWLDFFASVVPSSIIYLIVRFCYA